MSLRCHDGSCTEISGSLTSGVPAHIVQFESTILQRQGGRTLQDLTGDASYHAYWTTMKISTEHSLETVWREYVHYPAPRFLPIVGQNRSLRFRNPARTGETTFVYFALLPGGWVEHLVRPDIFALANLTIEGRHLLYPGYIIRWLERQPDGAVLSHTLGRGTGLVPGFNETAGSVMFMQLDRNVSANL